MMLRNAVEFENTREKLRLLETRFEALRNGAEPDERLRDLSMRSLKRLINQFKEEIARYEAHHGLRKQHPPNAA